MPLFITHLGQIDEKNSDFKIPEIPGCCPTKFWLIFTGGKCDFKGVKSKNEIDKNFWKFRIFTSKKILLIKFWKKFQKHIDFTYKNGTHFWQKIKSEFFSENVHSLAQCGKKSKTALFMTSTYFCWISTTLIRETQHVIKHLFSLYIALYSSI